MKDAPLKFEIPYKFEPRSYQLPFLKAMDNGIKRAVCAFHRGAGKDLMALNYLIKRACEKPGVYLHCFPNFSQAKRAIWTSVHNTHDGDAMAYLEHFPEPMIKSKNGSEMIIQLKNGSIYCLMGLDGKNAQRARGMNPCFVILSEYAYMDPESWYTIEPRITQNNGTAIFLSTPNGQNHFYSIYNHAKENPRDYYASLLTVSDTHCVEESHIEKLRGEGYPEDLIQQEYYCSFKRGAQGSYYGNIIQKARDEERIQALPTHTDLPVHTAWDIGVGDSTAIWFVQELRNGTYNVINYYENTGEGLEHYVNYLNKFRDTKGIQYGRHFVPHDMANREFTSGVDRLQAAREFGYNMNIVPKKSIDEGIQAVRSILNLCSFDPKSCDRGIKCLDFYRKKWNESLKVYYDEPLHDQWSHGADAFRMFAVGVRAIGTHARGSIENDMKAINSYWGR